MEGIDVKIIVAVITSVTSIIVALISSLRARTAKRREIESNEKLKEQEQAFQKTIKEKEFQFQNKLADQQHLLKMKKQEHAERLKSIYKIHSERFEILKEFTHLQAEFEHCVDHIIRGNSHYAERLQEYHDKMRSHARQNRQLLSDDFERAVYDLTDSGHTVLLANFRVTPQVLGTLKENGLPDSIMDMLQSKQNREIGVLDARILVDLFKLPEYENDARYRRDVRYWRTTLLNDSFQNFDHISYHRAKERVNEIKSQLQKTAPQL